MDISINPEDLD